MQSPTSVIITSMAAASGSRTQPMRSACSPKVNQVKLWKARQPGACSVGTNAMTAITSATIWPRTASAAAPLPRELLRHKIDNAAASGIAGISQRLATIQ